MEDQRIETKIILIDVQLQTFPSVTWCVKHEKWISTLYKWLLTLILESLKTGNETGFIGKFYTGSKILI